jgi:hypothetical protein
MSRIRPEHETKDNSLECASRLSGLPLEFLVGFNHRIGGVDFVVDTDGVSVWVGFVELFERGEVEATTHGIEHGTPNDLGEWAKEEARNCVQWNGRCR